MKPSIRRSGWPISGLAPFENRLPDDTYWAAKQVMAFSDEDLQALVSTGQYSDPEAAAWIVRSLAGRRDRIGEAYFSQVLPLDNFRVENDELAVDDLASHTVPITAKLLGELSRLDNQSEEHTEISTALAARGRSTFSELRWYPPMEAAKGVAELGFFGPSSRNQSEQALKTLEQRQNQ